MIHKFISNDNKGNVNTLEIGSDYTKISKVVDPVNSDDVANKKYVDQAGGSGLPDTPGTDGTYALMNTVESGTGAVSWVKPLVVSITDGAMSSTFAEISDAHRSGRPVIVFIESSGEFNYSVSSNVLSVSADEDNDMYQVFLINESGNIGVYMASSRNGYPEST